uniref:SGNH domain-containing protein n=1 Tax=Panagrolaimus sp. PS1159 TaxID=55785 RepID=A0AC35GUH4_9BILA
LNKTSTKTIMITGNSFVYFQIRGILEAIKNSKTKFSKAFVAAHIGCSLMAGTFNQKVIDWNCEKIDGSHNDLFNAVKPDVIIHTARLDHIIYDPIAPGDISNDIYYKEIERIILSMAKYTKKLIIIEPSPSLVEQTSITDEKHYKNPLTIAHEILVNGSLNEYKLSIEEYRNKMYPAWNRVKEAAKKCSNCILIPTENLFCNETECPLVDFKTKLGRYCDFSHITPKESLKFVPALIKAIDSK